MAGQAAGWPALPAALLRALQTADGALYVEVSDGVLLAFRPQHAVENETWAAAMVALATALSSGASG